MPLGDHYAGDDAFVRFAAVDDPELDTPIRKWGGCPGLVAACGGDALLARALFRRLPSARPNGSFPGCRFWKGCPEPCVSATRAALPASKRRRCAFPRSDGLPPPGRPGIPRACVSVSP